jgi:uncharacterized protein YbcV (DUF1398 family)
MDIQTFDETTKQSLAGEIIFPEVVRRLIESGTERYLIDMVGKRKLGWGTDGQSHSGDLGYDGPDVPVMLDAAVVRATIRDSQQGRITYQEFLDRVMRAGCSHYEVFITGKKAIYFGRDGSQHIELFPAPAV